MTGIELITQEREKQISKYNQENDCSYNKGDLLVFTKFCMCLDDDAERESIIDYLVDIGFEIDYLIDVINKSEIERLSIAGALIAAEIDRIEATLNNKIDN